MYPSTSLVALISADRLRAAEAARRTRRAGGSKPTARRGPYLSVAAIVRRQASAASTQRSGG